MSVAAMISFLLAACSMPGGQPTPTPAALPVYTPMAEAAPISAGAPTAEAAPVRQQGAAPARTNYTAEIIPQDQVPVVAEVAGQVLDLSIEVGDRVEAGEVIVRIDSSTLEAQRAQAMAGLEAAKAQLDLLQDEPEDEDIEAARASVTAAEEAYQRALAGPTAEELRMAEAQLRQAEAAVKQAQAAYDQVSWNPLIAALPESMQLEAATLALEAAQAQYDKLVLGATADIIAGAYAQLANARAQLKRLEDGAKPAQIQAAQAQVRQAETALYLAQLQLDKASVRAPISGIVASVNTSAGTMVAPGSPLAVLISPEVEVVIAVEESRLADLSAGQPAVIRVDAYSDRTYDGQIAIIAPTLDPATRTVQVTIRPTGDATDLAPGMFATVALP
jgi:HlyD family secretion protein